MSVGPVNDFAPAEPMKEAGVWMIPDVGVPYVSVQVASTLDLVSGYSQFAPQPDVAKQSDKGLRTTSRHAST